MPVKQGTYRGESNVKAKLTEAEVLEIYENHMKLTQHVLARKYRISQPTVCSIQRGHTWAWLTEEK